MPRDRIPVVVVSAVIVAALALVAPRAGAEVPNQTPEQLRRHATHAVAGEVQTLYASVSRVGDYEETKGVAEIRVTDVEKGDGPKPGDLVYARYWTRKWVGAGHPPPGSAGHRGLPKAGDTVHVHLKRADDGGYNVLLPNGFRTIRPAKEN
jgi:hypothetical protein